MSSFSREHDCIRTLTNCYGNVRDFCTSWCRMDMARLGIDEELVALARELVRINGTTKAPVMNYAAESVLGGVTIRVCLTTERFIHNKLRLIDTDAALFFYIIAAMDWVLL